MNPNCKQSLDLNDPALVSAIDEAPLWSVPFGQALLDTVILKRGLQVLDIGCGLGYPMLELAQRLGSSSRIIGLDPWQAAADRLKFKMKQYGVTNVTVLSGVAEAMPFEEKTFDLITSNNGLNNVVDQDQAWQECCRVAKPGAQLVFTENLPETMLEFYTLFEATLMELNLSEVVRAMQAHIDSKRKPLSETMARIERAGFRIQDIRHHRFCLRFLDGTTLFKHFLIQIAFLESWRAIVPHAHRAEVFQGLEAKLNELANKEGDLTLTVPFVCVDCRKPEGGVAV